MEAIEHLKHARIIFWDFDGVIKNSVMVKTDAFEQLFLPFGEEVVVKVRSHHEVNGGMSRYDKLPIYLEWAGQVLSTELIDEFAGNFSKLVKQKVIDSEWVSGVLDYLKQNYQSQKFFLVTATPQKEIEDIVAQLNIAHYFQKIIGAPTNKGDAIHAVLKDNTIRSDQAVMIGDSISDYHAAVANNVPFVLRKTELNQDLQKDLDCLMIEDFLDE